MNLRHSFLFLVSETEEKYKRGTFRWMRKGTAFPLPVGNYSPTFYEY